MSPKFSLSALSVAANCLSMKIDIPYPSLDLAAGKTDMAMYANKSHHGCTLKEA